MKIEDIDKVTKLIEKRVQLDQLLKTDAIQLCPNGGFTGRIDKSLWADKKDGVLLSRIKKAIDHEVEIVCLQLEALGVIAKP